MKIKMKMGAKQAKNAFAVCRAMQKKKGWGERKYERCVKEVKASMGKKKR